MRFRFTVVGFLLIILAAAYCLTMIIVFMKKNFADVAVSADNINSREIIIRVNKDGYFLSDNSRVEDELKLARGHVKLVFRYGEDLVQAAGQKELFNHQIVVRNDATKFYRESSALTPENPVSTLEFNVGENGETEYQLYCQLTCLGMGHLFKKITVIGS